MSKVHDYTEYFKSHKGLNRLVQKLYEKYASFGRITGIIKLENISEIEVIDLSRLLGEKYQVNDTVKVSVTKLTKIMNSSRFEDFNFIILLEEYMGQSLITNKEIRAEKKNEEEKFYESILSVKPSSWLENVINTKCEPYSLIHRRYLKNKESLYKELLNIITLVGNLPEKPISLPIYSSTHTQDPHYLDLDNTHIQLFFYALSFQTKKDIPLTREEKIMFLKSNNIIIDTISNYVVTYNLISDRDDITSFGKCYEPLNLNIQNILNTNTFKSINDKVFILENPSLLLEIIDKRIKASIIITSGNPNLSVYLLLDKLNISGCEFYYNGDFDPEGMIIADKLKNKYPNLRLFDYTEENYLKSMSSCVIDNARISKMKKISNNELKSIIKLIEENKKAGYQETIKTSIIDFIIKKVSE